MYESLGLTEEVEPGMEYDLTQFQQKCFALLSHNIISYTVCKVKKSCPNCSFQVKRELCVFEMCVYV